MTSFWRAIGVAFVGGIVLHLFVESAGINDWWAGWMTGLFVGWLIWKLD